jgi:hypothetical protein
MKLINTASDCTIKDFMSAKFDGKLSVLGEGTESELLEALDSIETEYNDLAGNLPPELMKSNKFNKLNTRKAGVELNFIIIEEIIRRIYDQIPVEALNSPEAVEYLAIPKSRIDTAISNLKVFGVNLKWSQDIGLFKKQLKKERLREITKHVELQELKKEIELMPNSEAAAPQQLTKKLFYQSIHAIQALGFKVSEAETNMYSFGVMRFEYFEMTKKQSGS